MGKLLDLILENKKGYRMESGRPSETLKSRGWNFQSKVGYLGTGYYFYGDRETAEKDRDFLNRSHRPIEEIDLSQYKLFRGEDPVKFYDLLKSLTREIGLYAASEESLGEEDLGEAMEEIIQIIQGEMSLPLTDQKIKEIVMGFIKDIQERKDGTLLSNRLLEPLGFQGIDNTNTPLDNYGVGSLIFM